MTMLALELAAMTFLLFYRRAPIGGPGLKPQIEDNQPFILKDAWKPRAQVPVHFRVIVQPPQSGTCKSNKIRSGFLQPLQLFNCRSIVAGRPPIMSFPFQERDAPPAQHNISGSPQVVVDKNESVTRRDQARYLLLSLANLAHPFP